MPNKAFAFKMEVTSRKREQITEQLEALSCQGDGMKDRVGYVDSLRVRKDYHLITTGALPESCQQGTGGPNESTE